MLIGQRKRPCVPLTRASWHAGEYRWHSSSTVGPWARHFTSLNLSFLMPQMRTLKMSLPLNEKCKERAYLAETWHIMSALIIITRIMFSLLTHGRKSKKMHQRRYFIIINKLLATNVTTHSKTQHQSWSELSAPLEWENKQEIMPSLRNRASGLNSTAMIAICNKQNIYETWSRVLFLGERIQMHWGTPHIEWWHPYIPAWPGHVFFHFSCSMENQESLMQGRNKGHPSPSTASV